MPSLLSFGLRPEILRNLIRNPLTYLGALVVVGDQVSKSLLRDHLPLHGTRVIIPGFFDLVHVRNTGAAFSLLAGTHTSWRQALFVMISVAALGILIYLLSRTQDQDVWTRRGLVLILGGAVGNLVDRVRFGEVVDFLYFHLGDFHWPAFNVADSAITVGAGILMVLLVRPTSPGN